jgi:hypothetical protein
MVCEEVSGFGVRFASGVGRDVGRGVVEIGLY